MLSKRSSLTVFRSDKVVQYDLPGVSEFRSAMQQKRQGLDNTSFQVAGQRGRMKDDRVKK